MRGHLRAGGGRQGDENHLDGLGRDDGGQSRAGAEDLHAMNEAAGLGRIVVDEADDLVRQGWILVDLAEQGDSGVAGAIDQCPFLRDAGSADLENSTASLTARRAPAVIPKQSRKSRK